VNAPSFSSFRLAARLARREVRRRPGRTLLVALLVAIPVAGMTVGAVVLRTDHQSAIQHWRATYGSADLVVTADAPPATSALPPGTHVVAAHEWFRVLRTVDGRRGRAQVSDLPLTDPMVEDIVHIDDGRVPTAANEVFLTRTVARDLGVHTGDVVELARPLAAQVTVTGIGERTDGWGAEDAWFGPGTALPSTDAATTFLVDLPDGLAPADVTTVLRTLAPDEVAPGLSADLPTSSTGGAAVRWTWVIGAIALAVVSIVIASAFAAGARRQLTTLGQLAANGAAPRVLRGVLFLQGTWTGIVGALLGLGLGAASLAALAPHIDRVLQRNVNPYTVRAADLVPAVLLGIAAATIAALIPARTTSRVPVLAALAGRRPLTAVPRGLTAAGMALAGTGLTLLALAAVGAAGPSDGNGHVWALTAAAGGVAVLLGACAVAPGYVSALGPAASRMNGPWRLAARSLVRQRTRTASVVSAVCATSALAVASSALVLGLSAQDRHDTTGPRPDEIQLFTQAGGTEAALTDPRVQQLIDDIRDAVPNMTAQTITEIAPDQSSRLVVRTGGAVSLDRRTDVAVADATLLDVYQLNRADQAALQRAGALALGPASGDGSIAMPGVDGARGPEIPLVVVPEARYQTGALPRLVVTPEAAATLGLTDTVPGAAVLDAPQKLTHDQRNEVSDLIETFVDEQIDPDGIPARRAGDGGRIERVGVDHKPLIGIAWSSRSGGPDPLILEATMSGVAFVFALFVVGVSLALATSETRDERDVLLVIGSSPATMRRTSGRKAVLLTAMGALLAVPVGFLPIVVFTRADPGDLPLVFPWRLVALLVVALPVLAGVVTTAGSAIALRLRPVRASTMSFD
jgi:putative ABC transport system permease protein